MPRRHRVFFRVGAWGCIATAAVHIAGQLVPRPAPADDTEAALFRLLEPYCKDVGAGMIRSTMDFLNGFSVSFSRLLAWAGVVALVVQGRNAQDAAFMARCSRVCTVFAAGLLAVSIVDFFLPPILCLAVITAGLDGAAFPSGSAAGRPTA